MERTPEFGAQEQERWRVHNFHPEQLKLSDKVRQEELRGVSSTDNILWHMSNNPNWCPISQRAMEKYVHTVESIGARPMHDPDLVQPAITVPHEMFGSQELFEIKGTLEHAAGERDNDPGRRLVGYAARQHKGLHHDVLLVDLEWQGKKIPGNLTCLVNATYTPIHEAGYRYGEEGCVSTMNLAGKVIRARTVLLEGYILTEEGIKPIRRIVRGDAAVALQHEIDHNQGILFADKAQEEGNQLLCTVPECGVAHKRQRQTWPLTATREQLLAMKSGEYYESLTTEVYTTDEVKERWDLAA